MRNEDFAVRSSFELSYRALLADDERAAMAFQLLGFAELSTLTGAAAAALFGCPATASDAILERLVDGHLLEEGRDGRFGMHDLLRLYAGERAAADLSASQRHDALLRLLSWYLAGLRANGLTAGRFHDNTWLTQECGNLLALVRAHAHAPGSAAALVLSIVDELCRTSTSAGPGGTCWTWAPSRSRWPIAAASPSRWPARGLSSVYPSTHGAARPVALR